MPKEGRSVLIQKALPLGWFLLGGVLAAVPLALLAEGFLRLCPPKDLHPYLGEASPLTGPFAPDHDFGVTYRSWEAFCDDNRERLAPFLPLPARSDALPVWALFGNSFVQAPGMLGDVARERVHDRRVFYLGRNEHLCVRLAQLKLLLEHGLEPERVFFELMPVDLVTLGEQPFSTLQVTTRGALTYRPRLPGGVAGLLVRHSSLALTAQVRAGWQRGNPSFNGKRLYEGIDAPLLSDLEHVFGNLARVARQKQVPVTVLLIPAYHQVVGGASFRFQDTLAGLLRGQGYDVLDLRAPYCRHPDPASLFLPDKHFNRAGNELLLDAILRHINPPGQLAHQGRSARKL
jgi:hypothetical protein